MEVVVTLLLAAAVMLLLATAMGLILGWANRAFFVPVDPRISAVDAALPGANCGGCGYVGCGEYAEAVVKEGASVDRCPVGGGACADAIAQVMKVSVEASWPTRPVVHCSAGYDERLLRVPYEGEPTCQAANMVNVQGCTYGCLGFGDCVTACNYNAMHIRDGLAVVDYDACVGCGACAPACPRNIISLVPFKTERVLAVLCCNKDFGKDVTRVCSVGCIGCKACAKVHDLISMEGNVPVIDYEQYNGEDDFALAIDKCSRESLVWVGRPSAADLVGAAAEELPDRVEADFKSTVDDADWRG